MKMEVSDQMGSGFEGAVVLVTGGGGGIGAGIARRLASNGAHVAVSDVSQEKAEGVAHSITALGGRASSHRLDVTSGEDVTRVVSAIERSAGPITLAVTCAGIINPRPFLELPSEQWDATLSVNLKGTFLVLQAVARRLVDLARPGRMVAIASVAARAGRPDTADYAASKAGVVSLVHSAALSLAPHGITVNAVCPGIVDTDMTRSIHEERGRRSGFTPEESLARIVATIPLGRIETADDVADGVLFLLSAEAGYITGQALNVCGGMVMS